MNGIRKLVKTKEEVDVAIAIYKDLGVKEHDMMENLDKEFPDFAVEYRKYAGKAKLEFYIRQVKELEKILTEINNPTYECQN